MLTLAELIIDNKLNIMIRPLLIGLICFLTLFACKNDTSGSSESAATTDTSLSVESSSKAASSTNTTVKTKDAESSVRNSICGIMVKSVDLKGSTLSIEYYKSADEYKERIDNPKMDAEFFKQYWSTAARAKKVMALVPSQLLSEYANIDQVDMRLYTGEKALSTSISRDKLAHFVGQSWEEIQTDWANNYRFVVVNNAAKRNAFFDQLVTVE